MYCVHYVQQLFVSLFDTAADRSGNAWLAIAAGNQAKIGDSSQIHFFRLCVHKLAWLKQTAVMGSRRRGCARQPS
jgi:hypothetical protein